MANVIIKSQEQQSREQKILKDFGIHPACASSAQRELAQHIAEKCHQAAKGGRHA